MPKWIKRIAFDVGSVIVGVAVAIAVQLGGHTDFTSLVSVVATVAGTLLGFLLTAVAIISALPNRRLLRNMARTGHSQIIHGELFGTAFVLILVTALSLGFFLVDGSAAGRLAALVSAYFALGIVTICCSGLKFYRVLTVAAMSPDPEGTGEDIRR